MADSQQLVRRSVHGTRDELRSRIAALKLQISEASKPTVPTKDQTQRRVIDERTLQGFMEGIERLEQMLDCMQQRTGGAYGRMGVVSQDRKHIRTVDNTLHKLEAFFAKEPPVPQDEQENMHKS